MSVEFLAKLPLFAGLQKEDLEQLFAMSELQTLETGDVLMAEGDPGTSAYVLLNGEMEITKHTGERETVLDRRGAGELLGEIALLEGCARSATVRAATPARVLCISRDTFHTVLVKSPSAMSAVLGTVTKRLRNSEMALRQNEKMAALGTLSAGLAHELNNPSAAVQRSAGQLRSALAQLQRMAAELNRAGFTAAQMEVVARLRREMPEREPLPSALDPLARSDLESELQDWLDERGVEGAWELAPAIANFAWTRDDLETLTRGFDPGQAAAFGCWLGAGCTVYALLDEVHTGAERISDIVKAVKSYSQLDRAAIQLVDVHEGIEDTLVILRYKLKQGVTVSREYDRSLPRIEAYASELNQVWTNIIDNAVDAMQGKGELRIKTYLDPANLASDDIVVEITDNGPGIPAEIQPRIFEAFFTTKAPGVGTGLGLNIAYNIVVRQHRGEIEVVSRPGQTTFTVRLPLRIAEPQPVAQVTVREPVEEEA
jgi:signal transduction histidine kinase